MKKALNFACLLIVFTLTLALDVGASLKNDIVNDVGISYVMPANNDQIMLLNSIDQNQISGYLPVEAQLNYSDEVSVAIRAKSEAILTDYGNLSKRYEVNSNCFLQGLAKLNNWNNVNQKANERFYLGFGSGGICF